VYQNGLNLVNVIASYFCYDIPLNLKFIKTSMTSTRKSSICNQVYFSSAVSLSCCRVLALRYARRSAWCFLRCCSPYPAVSTACAWTIRHLPAGEFHESCAKLIAPGSCSYPWFLRQACHILGITSALFLKLCGIPPKRCVICSV
jgi:hypothetical protein